MIRLFQQLAVVVFAFFKRRLHRLALDDFLLQFLVRGGQLHRALAQHLHDFVQVEGSLVRRVANLLDRGDCLGEKRSRPLDNHGASASRDAGQHPGNQDLLVELGDVECLQFGGRRPLPHPVRPQQGCLRALLQIGQQRRLIVSGKFAFHVLPNSRATRRTDLADFSTSRCVLAISFFSPLVLIRASCFKLGDFVLKFAADFPAFILLRRQHLVRQLPQPFLQLQGILQ